MKREMRLEGDATRIDAAMLGVLEDYANENGRNDGAVEFLGTTHRGEDILTSLHLLETALGKGNPVWRELYDTNPKYYLDELGNLFRGTSAQGRYVGSLEMHHVAALR